MCLKWVKEQQIGIVKLPGSPKDSSVGINRISSTPWVSNLSQVGSNGLIGAQKVALFVK